MASLENFISKGEISPIYILQSQQELLVQEARELIFNFLKKQDFLDKKIYTQNAFFNWGELIGDLSSQSFFGDKKIFDLRFPEAKLGRDGAKMISQVAKLANKENVIVISLPLDWQVQKSIWLKELIKLGANFELKVPSFSELSAWLTSRLKQYQLNINAEALKYFVEYIDGNLLAAKQEIIKLSAIFANTPNKTISLEDLKTNIIDASRFEASDLRTAYLSGNWQRALHIIDRLENDGTHPLMISWLINDDINKAMKVFARVRDGANERDALFAEKLFYDRAENIKVFYKKCKNPIFFQQLLDSEHLDLACKNVGDENVWQIIRRRIMQMA